MSIIGTQQEETLTLRTRPMTMPVMETYGRIRPVRPLGLARGVPSSDTAEAGDSSRVFCHILFIFENFGGAARDGFPSVRGTFAKGLGRVHRSHARHLPGHTQRQIMCSTQNLPVRESSYCYRIRDTSTLTRKYMYTTLHLAISCFTHASLQWCRGSCPRLIVWSSNKVNRFLGLD